MLAVAAAVQVPRREQAVLAAAQTGQQVVPVTQELLIRGVAAAALLAVLGL
jgi:hypothetical protein